VRSAYFVLMLALALAQSGANANSEQALGQRLFTKEAGPTCASCHALKAAGSTGAVGPVLDEIKPNAARVANAVRNGLGLMPSYASSLSEAQIEALAAYVSQVSGGAK
jgi:cytochrome c6